MASWGGAVVEDRTFFRILISTNKKKLWKIPVRYVTQIYFLIFSCNFVSKISIIRRRLRRLKVRSSSPHEAIGGAEDLIALKQHYICIILGESPRTNEFPKFICVFDKKINLTKFNKIHQNRKLFFIKLKKN